MRARNKVALCFEEKKGDGVDVESGCNKKEGSDALECSEFNRSDRQERCI